MNNLLKIGIDKNTIDEMYKNNEEGVVSYLNYNYEYVKEILDNLSFLKKETINQLLTYYNDIFFIDRDTAIKAFTAPELKGLKDQIDANPFILYEIFGI